MPLATRRAWAARTAVAVGAIRWDAYYTGTDQEAIRSSVAAMLGPRKWQFRAPACSVPVGDDKISFQSCGTQVQIDKEISEAHAANIAYWAYCWYGSDNILQNAWRLHQASAVKNLINWCYIFNFTTLNKEVSERTSQILLSLQQKNYQTVLSGRPLVYILKNPYNNDVSQSIGALRAACAKGSVATPYIVLLLQGPDGMAVSQSGADAIGAYAKASPVPVGGAYADLVKVAEAYWNTLAATGQPMIPTAMTGWDRRSRAEHPVPGWELNVPKPWDGQIPFYYPGSPSEIERHVSDMLSWVRSHPEACPAQTALIYSWDEHDEGGSTLNPTLGDGDAVLKAVGKARACP